jgi:hypothetical protein
VLANGKDCHTQIQPSGEKDSAASLSAAPDSVLLNNLKEWSDADFEQCLGDCEWQDTLTKLKLSRRSSLARVTLDPDCLSFPTLTSGDRSLTSRPAGQTKCEKWFKDNGLIPPGYQLSAQAMALMMGFPEDWFDCLSPPITQDESEPDTSPAGLLRQDKRRSPSVESSTSTASSSENVLRVMKEPETVLMVSNSPNLTISTSPELKDNSSAVLMVTPDLGNPVTISTNSENHGEREAVLMVTPDNSNPVTISTQRRGKGLGTGRIQWRTVTKKNGKQYQQAWYDWQTTEGGKTQGKSAYIPKRLLTKVQALEAASSPVQEVLLVLGVGKHQGESSICPARGQPLSSLENGCVVCGWGSPGGEQALLTPIKSPTNFRRKNTPSDESKSPTNFRRKNTPSDESKSPTNFRRKNTPPDESKSPTKRRGKNQIPASGHISPTIQRKDGKEYPRVQGERVPRDLAWDYPEQFVWIYNWCVADEDGCWKNRSKRVPTGKIYSVRSAITTNKPVEEILKFIEQQ